MDPALSIAYAQLDVKSFDADTRTIEGIVTTPEPDRRGHTRHPEAAQFSLPMPLLWQHDQQQPIGNVIAARVSPAGIAITATIATIAEPGKLKDRIDEAWQSIKSRLVRGLSIGFKPTK